MHSVPELDVPRFEMNDVARPKMNLAKSAVSGDLSGFFPRKCNPFLFQVRVRRNFKPRNSAFAGPTIGTGGNDALETALRFVARSFPLRRFHFVDERIRNRRQFVRFHRLGPKSSSLCKQTNGAAIYLPVHNLLGVELSSAGCSKERKEAILRQSDYY